MDGPITINPVKAALAQARREDHEERHASHEEEIKALRREIESLRTEVRAVIEMMERMQTP